MLAQPFPSPTGILLATSSGVGSRQRKVRKKTRGPTPPFRVNEYRRGPRYSFAKDARFHHKVVSYRIPRNRVNAPKKYIGDIGVIRIAQAPITQIYKFCVSKDDN